MAYEFFQNKETEYQNWIASNPHGYVLTTTKDISISYMSLHRATCRTISQYMSNMANGAFTEKNYMKICSNNYGDLTDWIETQGGTGFTKLCSKCSPNMSGHLIDDGRQLHREFEAEIEKSARSTSEERRKRLRAATKKPAIIIVSTAVFRRNPDVVAEILFRANGYCEECGDEAPFTRASDGTPYLEVHHCTPLSEG
jgi:hypothetical protein